MVASMARAPAAIIMSPYGLLPIARRSLRVAGAASMRPRITALIARRKGAQLASGPASSRQRNRNIAAQARLGKGKWHTESGYSKRSKVETTFHR